MGFGYSKKIARTPKRGCVSKYMCVCVYLMLIALAIHYISTFYILYLVIFIATLRVYENEFPEIY